MSRRVGDVKASVTFADDFLFLLRVEDEAVVEQVHIITLRNREPSPT